MQNQSVTRACFYIYNGVAAKFTNVETRNSAFSVLNATLKKNDFNVISGSVIYILHAADESEQCALHFKTIALARLYYAASNNCIKNLDFCFFFLK